MPPPLTHPPRPPTESPLSPGPAPPPRLPLGQGGARTGVEGRQRGGTMTADAGGGPTGSGHANPQLPPHPACPSRVRLASPSPHQQRRPRSAGRPVTYSRRRSATAHPGWRGKRGAPNGRPRPGIRDTVEQEASGTPTQHVDGRPRIVVTGQEEARQPWQDSQTTEGN